MTISKIVVLDRDGVINVDLLTYVTKKEDFVPIKNSLEAISLLNRNGFKVAIATNQACIEEKIISDKDLNEIHTYMKVLLKKFGGEIEYIAYCPHSPKTNCNCRKPKTGLLKEIEINMGISLKNKYFVGDKISDLIAGSDYGCVPLLIKNGPYGEKAYISKECPPIEHCFNDLMEASQFIVNNSINTP